MPIPNSPDRAKLAAWQPLRVIGEHRRAYVALNACAYGLVLVGFGIGLLFPRLRDSQQVRLEEDGTADLALSVFRNPWIFALVILAVNIVKLSLVTIVAPSMVVPFAGLALFAYWAAQTGVTLVPASDVGWVALIPHSVTLIVELQAYILLLLGAHVLGVAWLRPESVGVQTHRSGYLRGLRRLGWLAVPAAFLLVIGAVYEAFSIRYLIHPLTQWLL
ncbi:stage II sporulation protein M [Mycolicibacterium sp. 018/SC-01/001]|uniref:stage II sporulation protein M n=1 Tax=Mycolicibacterium sp. 018/SC-01/001 TaxID=2592069 RepID=UPI00117C1029|nr:stage II sporulation protein M [Mycolicibacterium sp. 018/SC-01/001]TRW89104.1 stage II sporulation protein M [Mycolicibacterium sp. 018/SC-01/001]